MGAEYTCEAGRLSYRPPTDYRLANIYLSSYFHKGLATLLPQSRPTSPRLRTLPPKWLWEEGYTRLNYAEQVPQLSIRFPTYNEHASPTHQIRTQALESPVPIRTQALEPPLDIALFSDNSDDAESLLDIEHFFGDSHDAGPSPSLGTRNSPTLSEPDNEHEDVYRPHTIYL